MGTKGKHWCWSEESRKKRSLVYRGRHLSPATEFKVGQLEGEDNPQWRGGRESYYRNQGIKVWEEYWKEKVPIGYLIHHVDKNATNNKIHNLAMITKALHQYIHHKDNFSHPHTGVSKEHFGGI